MDTGGSVFESVPSETELDDSYIQGNSRICKVKKCYTESFQCLQCCKPYGGGHG